MNVIHLVCLAVTNAGNTQKIKPVKSYKGFRFSVFHAAVTRLNFNKAIDLHQHVCCLPSKTKDKQGNDTCSASILYRRALS